MSAFWGVELTPGNVYQQTPPETVHLSQAALGVVEKSNKGVGERSVLQVTIAGRTFAVCSLRLNGTEFAALDLIIPAGEDVAFEVVGPLPIHLLGYSVPEDEDDDDLSSFEEDDEEDGMEDEEARALRQAMYGGSDSDDDDSDDDDFDDEDDDDSDDDDDADSESESESEDDNVGARGKKGKEIATKAELKKLKPSPKISELVDAEGDSDGSADDSDSDGEDVMSFSGDDSDDAAPPPAKKGAAKGAKGAAAAAAAAGPKKATKAELIAEMKKMRDEELGAAKSNNNNNNNNKDTNSKKRTAAEGAPAAAAAAATTPAQKKVKTDVTTPPVTKQQQKPATPTATTTPGGSKALNLGDGLVAKEVALGKGKKAQPGRKVTVKYVGSLTNGKVFDQGKINFRLGVGEVIKGWDRGITNMCVGGRRELTVPPALAYGKKGAGPDIPGNSTLRFQVELLNVQ